MITIEMLDSLRKRVSRILSDKRYCHTLGVEKSALLLTEYCLPDKENEISAAALLHDITKELDIKEQYEIISVLGEQLSEFDKISPAVLHAYSAPYKIKSDFPDFSTAEILSAVRKHTLGDKEMSVFDEIVFLADFIEEGRIYDSSRNLREYVYSNMTPRLFLENVEILHRACILAIDFTSDYLTKAGKSIHPKMLEARAGIISKI